MQKGIFNGGEKYVAISQTEYKSDIVHDKFDANKVFNDLIKIGRSSKDFVFRTFVEHIENGQLSYIPDSISTGKSENIVTTNNIIVQTLNRYRNAIGTGAWQRNKGMDIINNSNGSGGGGGSDSEKSSIVKGIHNDVGNKDFSIEEQAITHLAIVKNLGISPKLSREAIEYEMEMRKHIERELELDLEKLLEMELELNFQAER